MKIQEEIFEEIIKSLVNDKSQQKLLCKIKELKRETPTTSSFSDNPFNMIPRTPEAALKRINYFQDFILNKTRLCYYYEISEKAARKKQKDAERKVKEVNEENEKLKLENKRLKQQIYKLLGLRKNKNKSDNSSSDKDQKKPDNNPEIPKKRGAPKGHRGNTRKTPDKADRLFKIEAYHQCKCGSCNVDGLPNFDSKFIEEIEFRVVVTEKRYMQGKCNECGSTVRHPDALKGPHVSIGNNTAVMLASMRQLMGCSYRKLSLFFSEYFNFPIQPSGVLGLVNRVSDSLEPVYAGIGELVRIQKYLNGDETGWKNNGKRWYLWCFCNTTLAYYHADQSRGSKVPKKILGEDYPGIVNCDFYGGYNFLSNTQRCLIHFQRDIHDEAEINPRGKGIQKLKTYIDEVIKSGKEIKKDQLKEKKLKEKAEFIEKTLTKAAQIETKEKTRPAVLVKRINKHKDSLARFASDTNIDFHNNRAEQMIRPAVIFRKISFGNRSDTGTVRYSILSSVIQTMRLQGKNIFTDINKIISMPAAERYKYVKEFDSS
jgi:transposase